MTAIVHFLITNVSQDPDIVNKFSFCFPATTNKELKDFKEAAFNELKNLEKLEIIPQDSLLGKSVLDTACGERLINFLRILSDATLIAKLKQIKNKNFKVQTFDINDKKKTTNSSSNQSLLELTKKSLIVHITLEKNK